MDSALVALGVSTFKLALFLAMPMLLVGLIAGLMVSIFQATTQINEMTLSFVPKIILVVVVLVIAMPWMMEQMLSFTTMVLNKIPGFVR